MLDRGQRATAGSERKPKQKPNQKRSHLAQADAEKGEVVDAGEVAPGAEATLNPLQRALGVSCVSCKL